MPEQCDVVFLHGLGQGAGVWDDVISHLPRRMTGHALALSIDETFSLDDAGDTVGRLLDELHLSSVVLCGLSLGAMVASHYSARHPERVSGLLLSGTQVAPNRTVMALQNVVIRTVPSRLMGRGSPSKQDLLAVLEELAGVDLGSDLRRIEAPTLVACGSRDRVNLRASRVAAELVPGAELVVIDGVGHERNATHPELFARMVADFARRPQTPSSSTRH